MKIYAVVDTNVLVAALLSKNVDSATIKVLKEISGGNIIPLYHSKILAEYTDVLNRDKFPIKKETAKGIIDIVKTFGIEVEPLSTGVTLPDRDDLIFYEVMKAKEDDGAYLITGNLKHYPREKTIMTPAKVIGRLENVDTMDKIVKMIISSRKERNK